MSSLLLDSAPLTLKIGGAEYPIITDYRTWVRFELLMLDDSLDDNVLFDAISLVFDGCLPPPELIGETVDQMMWFYRCGHPPDVPIGGDGTQKQRIYDYAVDDGYVYAAFLQQYGVDLQQQTQLHWWRFYAMFVSLAADCKFTEILGYRSTKISTKMSPEERRFYRRMQKMYALPQPKTEDDKKDEINARLIRGESLDGLL